MKKVLVVFVCLLAVFTWSASAQISGDCDGNGTVNINDVMVMLKGITDESVELPSSADMNADGSVDINDVLFLLKSVTQQNITPTEDPNAQKPIETVSNQIAVNDEDFKMVGRYHLNTGFSAYAFSNSGAGISFAFKGTSLEVKLASSAYNESNYTYAAVYIDDREPIAIKVTKSGWYTVAEDLEPEMLHNVRILKRSESNCGILVIETIKISEGGELYTAKPYPTDRKIQVLGDSITCGYGNLYNGGTYSCYTDVEDGTYTYATILGERYGAELDTVCISGIGLGTPDNEPWPILPAYKQQDNASYSDFDFTSFVPDVIIVALGTNDDAQGATHDEVKTAGTELIEFIRSKYPDAHIIWSYGIMSRGSMNAIDELIKSQQAKGDTKLHFLPTQADEANEGIGLYGHPNKKTHERMANEIGALIEQLTGWTPVEQ